MLNKVILIGNVGKKDEVRFLESGLCIQSFSLATSKKITTKTGEKTEKTTWHRCCAFGKQAETLNKFLTVGSKIYIDGEIDVNVREKEDGTKTSYTNISVNEFRFLSSKKEAHERAEALPDDFGNTDTSFTSDDIPF